MNVLKSVFTFLILGLAITGCKKDETNPVTNDPTPDRKGVYVGTVAFASASASVNFNVGTTLSKANEILPVTGVLHIVGGATVTLSGTYNTANDSTYVSGGGYTFAGHFGGGQISGTCGGPNGTGIFTVAVSTASNPVKVYTGTFSVSNGDHGSFNILITGTTLSGVAFILPGNVTFPFAGTVQGNNLTLVDPARANLLVANGTISAGGATVSGSTINTSGQANGTWSGTLVQ